MTDGSATPGVSTMTPMARIKAILGGSAGNLVEWYDWFAYTSTSLYFAKHFFPGEDPVGQQLQTAAIFAAGFIARPLGAWLMGIYADKAGRRAALTLSVALMSAGSFAIAILPVYAQVGIWAQLALLACRLVQGLSLGGEYGASATYMSEMSGAKRRGFWSSFQYMTLVGGQLTALLVLVILQHTLSTADLEAWGWRVPFFIGGLLAVVVFYIRTGLEETSSYIHAVEGEAKRGSTLTLVQAGVLILYMLVQPLMGWLSDHVGRKYTIAVGLGIGALVTYPVMSAIAVATSPLAAFGLIMILVLCHSGYSAVNAAVKAELFPAHIRALGVALPYALANAIFGGTAEYAAGWMKKLGHESVFYAYVAVVMMVAAIVAARLRNTNKTSLILED